MTATILMLVATGWASPCCPVGLLQQQYVTTRPITPNGLSTEI
ncbi:hypothetical protein [Polaromonas sp.]